MRIGKDNGIYLGADGCRGGWITAVLNSGELHLERYQSLEEIIAAWPESDAFLIDMVIGLRSNATQLRPDDLARKELGPRSSTIFPVPCRQAVYAETEEEQKQENIRVLGKSLAKQSINIIPKIREVDEFLCRHPEYKNKISESHPEFDFARLNGGVVLSRKKEFAGIEERKAILQRYLPGNSQVDFREKAKALKCNPDDVLDAVCLAVTAAMSVQGMCEIIPQDPEQDDTGLYMKLTVPKKGTHPGICDRQSRRESLCR